MKKLLVPLLSLVLVFAFASCNKDKPCESHVDADSNGKCDVCDAEVSTSKPGDTQGDESNDAPNPPASKVDGSKLAEGVIKQMLNTKSLKVEIEIHSLSDEESWYLDYDEDGNAVESENEYYFEVSGKIYLTLSYIDGDYRMEIKSNLESREDPSEAFESVEDIEAYFIDGYYYNKESDNTYTKQQSNLDFTEISKVFDDLTNGVEISEEDKASAYEFFGDIAYDFINVQALSSENKYEGGLSVDLKPVFNNLKEYINGLDVNTVKVRSVVDDALALVDADLTAEKIVTELDRVSGLSVNEALAELDAWLTENYETTLQGLYDSIVNDPSVIAVIRNALQMNMSENPSEDELAAVEAQIDEIRSFKIADYIAEAQMGEYKLYDLVMGMIGNTEEAPTREELVKMINDTLDMTLAAFDENTQLFTGVKDLINSIQIDALGVDVEVKFNDTFAIETIELNYDIDVIMKNESEVAGKFNTNKMSTEIGVTVYNISENPVDIKLPAGIEIFNDDITYMYYSNSNVAEEDNYYSDLYIGDNGDATYWIDFDMYIDELEIYVFADEIPSSSLDGYVLTIPSECLNFSCYGSALDHDLDVDLVIEIDPTYCTYTIIAMPEFDLSSVEA